MVSVILPIHNASRYLRECLDSLLRQTWSDFEVLAIDDGSTDDSAEIVKSFSDPRIRLLQNPSNLRLIKTLNRGIQEARRPFLMRMDADDICFPQRIERQLSWMRERPEIDVLGSWAIRIDERGRHGGVISKPQGDDLAYWSWVPTPLIHPTVMIRRERVGGDLYYDDQMLHCEDYELWLRLLSQGRVLENYPAPLLYYRIHPGGVSMQNRKVQLKNSYTAFLRFYSHTGITEDEFNFLIGVRQGGSLSERIRLTRRIAPALRGSRWIKLLGLQLRSMIPQ